MIAAVVAMLHVMALGGTGEEVATSELGDSQQLAILTPSEGKVPGHATHLVRLFPKEDARLADGVTDIRMNSIYIQFEKLRPVGKPGYMAVKSYPCERCGDK